MDFFRAFSFPSYALLTLGLAMSLLTGACGSGQKRGNETYSPGSSSPKANQSPRKISSDSSLLLRQAQVTDWRWQLAERKQAMLESLEMRCPDGFDYGKPSKPKIPRVTCQFKAPINADSYLCEFEFKGKAVELKVTRDETKTRSAFAANELSRMVGFAHTTSCPAVVVCDGCEKQLNGQFGKADAVVEMGFPGFQKTESSLPWKKLAEAATGGAENGLEGNLVEREALILWQSFLRTAASNENFSEFGFHLYCDSDCKRVAAIADSTSTLHSLNIDSWVQQKVFQDSKTCQVRGLAGAATVSDESRKWLLDKMRTVSRANLQDLFSIARFPEASGTPALWATGFFDKANQLAEIGKSQPCSPLAAEKSLLGQPLPVR